MPDRKEMDFLIDKFGWCGKFFYKDKDGVRVLKKWLALEKRITDVNKAFKFLYDFYFGILD